MTNEEMNQVTNNSWYWFFRCVWLPHVMDGQMLALGHE